MAGTNCPQCERAIPPDTVRESATFCPFCGWRQGRDVRPTVEEESALAGAVVAPLEEVSFTLKQSLVQSSLSALLITTMVASLAVFGVLLFVVCIGVLRAGFPPGRFGEALLLLAQFFGASWCFVAVGIVPAALFKSLTGRHRRMWVEDGRLCMKIGRSLDSWNLEECFWHECQVLAGDGRGYYFGDVQPRLVVVRRKDVCGLGFSDASARQWADYFEAGAVYRPPRVAWRKTAAQIAIAICMGGLMGYTIGLILFLLGAPVGVEGVLAFIGCIDGFMAIGCYWMCRNKLQFGKEGRAGIALLMAVAYACAAAKVVFIVWQIILLNAAIGAVIGWFIAPDRRAEESDSETLAR